MLPNRGGQGSVSGCGKMRAFVFVLAIGLVIGLALCTYLFDSVVSALGLAVLATLAVVGLVMVATTSSETTS